MHTLLEHTPIELFSVCHIYAYTCTSQMNKIEMEPTYDMVNISCFGHLSFRVTNILINMNWRSVWCTVSTVLCLFRSVPIAYSRYKYSAKNLILLVDVSFSDDSLWLCTAYIRIRCSQPIGSWLHVFFCWNMTSLHSFSSQTTRDYNQMCPIFAMSKRTKKKYLFNELRWLDLSNG